MSSVDRNAEEAIARISHAQGDAEFLLDLSSGRRYSFRAFDDLTREIASGLAARGLARGERIGLLLENGVECLGLYLAAHRAGFTVVPIHPLLNDRDVAYLLFQSGVRLLFHSPAFATRLPRLSGEGWNGAVEPVGPGDCERLRATRPQDLVPLAAEEVAEIVYTSGTTTRPKGVARRLGAILGNAEAFGQEIGIGPGHRFYANLPSASGPGLFNLFFIPYLAGAQVVVAGAFDVRQAMDFWSGPEASGANAFWFVPSILSLLRELDRGTRGARYAREKVRLALCGTAPLSASLRREIEGRYGFRIHESYGLTETLLLATHAPNRPVADGSVGRLLPGIEVRLAEDGEILVRTPHLMAGYIGADGRIEPPILEDGFFRTGDVGSVVDGEVHLADRKKDIIIRGGFNLSPAAIEEILLSHEGVAEAAVVGLLHDTQGEEVVAVIRIRPGRRWDEVRPGVERLARERLGRIQIPSYYLEVEDFPRSASGKIQKAVLRDLARERFPRPAP